MDWLDDEVREWVGGVGGGTGPVPSAPGLEPSRLDWRRNEGVESELRDKEVPDSAGPGDFVHATCWASSQASQLSSFGCGRILCLLNVRGPFAIGAEPGA